MYSENYNIVMKEIKDDTNRWRDKPYTWTGRINILKIYYSRQSTDSMQFLSIYQGHFFFFFKKTCFSLFILKSALYKTTREKSLKVKGVGRGEAPLSFGGPSRDWAPGQPSRASHVLAV